MRDGSTEAGLSLSHHVIWLLLALDVTTSVSHAAALKSISS